MIPFSVLDLAVVTEGSDAGAALRDSRALAQAADRLGFQRFWLAEHHNMPGIASAATALAIGFVAEGTERIRVGAGGIMLPNHAPLVVAEQFGTLHALYGDRIDLGLGRAPGTDQATVRALRRDPSSAERFPLDVMELLTLLGDPQPGQGIQAFPGSGSHVPVWLLGSSLFSARLAAHLGLPFAFASHFAPAQLHDALAVYRQGFQPSAYLERPHAMVAVNVYAADTEEHAQRMFTSLARQFLRLRTGRPGRLAAPDDSPLDRGALEATGVLRAIGCSAVGTRDTVRDQLAELIQETQADELIVAAMMFHRADRIRNLEIVAEVRNELAS